MDIKKNHILLEEAKLKHKKLYHYLNCYVVNTIWNRLNLANIINGYINYEKINFRCRHVCIIACSVKMHRATE